MVDIDKAALRAAREQLWYGLATIKTIQMTKNPQTKVLESSFVTLHEDIPCKLSHTKIQKNDQQTVGPGIIEHAIKVSINNDIEIPAGCEFVISQSGKTATYKQSGEAAVFIVHQEIPLIPKEDYA